MRQRTVMRQVLADTIDAEGEDALIEIICSRVAEGESPIDISRSMGLSWFVVREWLEGGGKMKRLELAKRCFADGLVWQSLEAARDATVEGVSVSKLQADHFSKMAGKMFRDDWGDKVQMQVTNTNIDIKALLDLREAKLLEVNEPARLVIDIEKEEVKTL